MRPPSVDSLANSILDTGLPKPLCVDVARSAIQAGDPDSVRERAQAQIKKILQPVINATGVLLHTNLGRAPSSFVQPQAYTNLEMDLNSGERGSRQEYIGYLFARLTGAEAGLVVNNCSAAVTLILAALTRREAESEKTIGKKEKGAGVVVSRGELVEIGGGFRVPEVIAQSGARLIEVGTTNRTRLKDYEKAIKRHSAALCLKVHQSNYAVKGFTESVNISDLANLGVPLIADIGSGLLDAACPWLKDGPPGWLAGEPAAKQSLQAGASLVAFSGDKLLGGVQAGIILGDGALIQKCAEHPLARAFRPGGLILASLAETAHHYLNREGEKIPFWEMACTSPEELKIRAEKIASELDSSESGLSDQLQIQECHSVPGGGTLPEVKIPSWGIVLNGDYSAQLRQQQMPILTRVQEGKTILDIRTVFPSQDEALAASLVTSLRALQV